MTPKVLVVLTSANEIPKLQKPTGWYLVCSQPRADLLLLLGLLVHHKRYTNQLLTISCPA